MMQDALTRWHAGITSGESIQNTGDRHLWIAVMTMAFGKAHDDVESLLGTQPLYGISKLQEHTQNTRNTSAL